ncbi:uncharacterized protein C8Q71DRAFT_381772 [Rhodofomes roseus]|nr:uncharacterized protein C8Q71DRAFT_381772 [Rhodofomes roseus]KAH9830193.1 hypothetical protein C8Q71DRAFT_381772 [Rhodofomes roseus]
MGDTFCSFVALPSEDDVQKGVKAGRKAAQGWQTRANEWRQRLVKKSSAIWRDRKNSVVQQPQPPVPLIPSLELLPAVEVGVHPQGRSSDTADTTDSSAPRRPVPGNVAVNARTEGQRDDDRDKDRRKPMGLRRVFSRAQLGSRGT